MILLSQIGRFHSSIRTKKSSRFRTYQARRLRATWWRFKAVNRRRSWRRRLRCSRRLRSLDLTAIIHMVTNESNQSHLKLRSSTSKIQKIKCSLRTKSYKAWRLTIFMSMYRIKRSRVAISNRNQEFHSQVIKATATGIWLHSLKQPLRTKYKMTIQHQEYHWMIRAHILLTYRVQWSTR